MAIQEITRIFTHSTQKGAARLILLAIADHADVNGFCFPSAQRLADYANLSTRHTERVIAQLKDTSELFVIPGGGRWKSNCYVILTNCDPEESARRIRHAYEKVAQNTDISSNKTPTSDTVTPTSYPETPTSAPQNTDILSNKTPTSTHNTPTSDTETPTSYPITPTHESDEPIEPLKNHQEEPSESEPPLEPSEREREPGTKTLSLIGYPQFQEKFFQICGLNPNLKPHQAKVGSTPADLWAAGYRITDLEKAAQKCQWMKIPPRPDQIIDAIGTPRPADWMNHEEWIRDQGPVWLELGELTDQQYHWLSFDQLIDYRHWIDYQQYLESEAVGGD